MIEDKDKFLDNLPGENGWYKEEYRKDYNELYMELMVCFPEHEVQNILLIAYWACANQYE